MYQDKMQSLRLQVLSQARSWIGTKFHHQGRSKKTDNQEGAIDCIGLVVGVAKELKIKTNEKEFISDYDVTDYSRLGIGDRLIKVLEQHFDKTDKIEIGNILLFKLMGQPQHVGIVGKNEIGFTLIHSYQGNDKVVEHQLTDKWLDRTIGIYQWRL